MFKTLPKSVDYPSSQAARSKGEKVPFTKRLLTTAVAAALTVAMGISSQAVADVEIAGTNEAGATVITLGANTESILNATEDNGAGTTDYGKITVSGGNSSADIKAAAIDIDHDAVLYIFGSGGGNAGLSLSGDIAVASGETFEIFLGSESTTHGDVNSFDNTQQQLYSGDSGSPKGGNLVITAGSGTTKGGRVRLFEENVDMTQIDIKGGDGDGTAVLGGPATANFGSFTGDSTVGANGASRIFDVTGMTITGGHAGTVATANPAGGWGGVAEASVSAIATIGTSGLVVTGGNATAAITASAGRATGLFYENVTSSGTVATQGGNAFDASGANGGVAEITFKKDLDATGQSLTITGGAAGGSDGNGGNATANFQGNVTFSSMTIADGADGTSSGVGGSGIATFSGTGAQNITGDIIGTAGTGDLTISNTSDTVTFAGTVGTNSNALGTLTLADSSTTVFQDEVGATSLGIGAATVNFAGSVTAPMNFTGAGDATFDGTGVQTITGAITTAADGAGDITISNTGDLVTFVNALGANGGNKLATLALADNSEVVFSDAIDVGDLDIGDATVTFSVAVNTDTVTLGNSTGATIVVGSGFGANDTVITATGAATENATTTIDLSSVTLADGESITIVAAASGLSNANYQLEPSDSFEYDLLSSTSMAIIVTVTEMVSSCEDTGILGNACAALLDGVSDIDLRLQGELDDAIAAGGKSAEKATRQVGVQTDALTASTAAAISAGQRVTGVAVTRLASMRTGDQYAGGMGTGLASGDKAKSEAFWVQTFGGWTNQGQRNGVDGYGAETYGVAGGFDVEVTPNSRIGFSLAYANTDVDGDGAGNAQVDIDGYHLTAYGDYTTDKYYLEGMLSYARNKNELSEQVLSATRKANYDADQYTVSVGGGMPIALHGSSGYLTPMANLTWTHLSADSYTTKGAGSLDLNVNPDDTDTVVGSLGAQFHTIIEKGNGEIIPSVYAGITYDFADDEAQSSNAFTGGGAVFTAKGADVERLGGKIGLGASYNKDHFSLGASYSLDFKSDYTNHAAMVEARWEF